MDHQNWYYRYKASTAWLSQFFTDIESAHKRQLLLMFDEYGVNSGLNVSQRGAGANFSVDVSSGDAYDDLGRRIYNDATINVPFTTDYLGASIAVASSGNERVVSVYAIYNLLDDVSTATTDGFGDTVYTRSTEDISFELVQGTEATAGTAVAAADPGRNGVKLADVTIAYGSSTVVTADIDDSDKYYLRIIPADTILYTELPVGAYNVEIDYNTGTGVWKLVDANGADFSEASPGIFVLPSISNPGTNVLLRLTTSPSFEDAAGTSDIVGQYYNTTTGVAWNNRRPIFFAGVNLDDVSEPVIALTQDYARQKTPASSALIGYKGNPSSTQNQYAWWFITSDSNITTDADSEQPAHIFGCMEWVKNSSNDWTFQSIQHERNGMYVFPWQTGAFYSKVDADFSGGIMGANGPGYSDVESKYCLEYGGWVTDVFNMQTSVTVGTGSAQSVVYLAYTASLDFTTGRIRGSTCLMQVGGSYRIPLALGPDGGSNFVGLTYFNGVSSIANIANDGWTSSGDSLELTTRFKAFG